jgi:hypothetical protein
MPEAAVVTDWSQRVTSNPFSLVSSRHSEYGSNGL